MQSPWFDLPSVTSPLHSIGDNNTPVVVIGAGLAGCNTAYELARQGKHVLLVDADDTIANGASGNYAGIVKPFVTREPGVIDEFYQRAFHALLQLFERQPQLSDTAHFNQCGVLQLIDRPYPNNDFYSTCTAEQACEIAGTTIDSPAIYFESGGWLNPSALCHGLIKHDNITCQLSTKVSDISSNSDGWTVNLVSNGAQASCSVECQTLVIANGHGLNQFEQTSALPITPARGQCSEFHLGESVALKTIVSGKRYAIPYSNTLNSNSIIVGASFDRGNSDNQFLTRDDQQNRAALETLLPTLTINDKAASGFCAVRATSPDRFPVVGPVPNFAFYEKAYALLKDGLPSNRFEPAQYLPGLFVIGGFGSRGIVSSRYCAKLLVNYLCGTDCKDIHTDTTTEPSLASWTQLLHPARFTVRNLKRVRSAV